MTNLSRYERLGKIRIDQLDGLRGACAIVVLIHHMIQLSPEGVLESICPITLLGIITNLGRLAVYIFFVLSGFVIGYTTPEKYTPKEAKKYILRRLIRLYPIYLFAILFSCFLSTELLKIKDIFGNLFFLQEWLVSTISNNGPLWSLHYEFFFYLIYILIWRFKLNLNITIVFSLFCALLSNIFSLHIFEILGLFTLWLGGFWLSQNIDKINLVNEDYSSTHFWSPLILCSAFFAQNIVGMLIIKYGITHSFPIPIFCSALAVIPLTSVVASLITKKIIPLYNFSLLFLLILCISTFIYHFQHKTNLLKIVENGNPAKISIILTVILTVLFFLSFLLRNIPIRFFKTTSYIGNFSYALYVIHFPILVFLNHINITFNPKSSNILCILLLNALGVILSISLAYFLESIVHVKIAKVLKKSLNL